MAACLVLFGAIASAAIGGGADRAVGQAPTATGSAVTPGASVTPGATMTAGAPATALPVPDLSGRWSVTRSWLRRCPGCMSTVVRTTPWTIEQQGGAVRIDRGPTGSIGSGGSGEGLLALEGLESGADGIYRFWYSTLRVAADGSSFEGEFAGSERIGNPCGSEPPVVTCFVTAGHLLARRIRLATPVATSGGSPAPTPGTVPPGAPTDTATPSTSPAPSATAPTPSAPAPTSSPPGTTTPTATAGTAGPSPTPGPTRLPLGRALLPDCRRR